MASIVKYADGFRERLETFTRTLQALINEHESKPTKVISEFGTKWVKIILEQSFDNRTVHCFIEPSGDIYKASGWSTPAKHSRGSIYNENCDVGTAVDVHGARYLK